MRYIVEHSGARMLLVDPELDDALAEVKCEHRYVIGAESDAALLRYGVEPAPWAGDEDATATINYTSGTTARPKGVQITHRNIWINAATFGWHVGVSDRDVYLHTLPAVPLQRLGDALRRHRHGRPAHRAAQGRRRRDPAPGRAPRRHPAVRRAGGAQHDPRRRRRVGRRGSGPRPRPDGRRRRPAADAHDRAHRDRAGLGVHPDLRAHRDVPAADDEPPAGRVRRPLPRRPRRPARTAPAGRPSAARSRSTTRARSSPAATS